MRPGRSGVREKPCYIPRASQCPVLTTAGHSVHTGKLSKTGDGEGLEMRLSKPGNETIDGLSTTVMCVQ